MKVVDVKIEGYGAWKTTTYTVEIAEGIYVDVLHDVGKDCVCIPNIDKDRGLSAYDDNGKVLEFEVNKKEVISFINMHRLGCFYCNPI